PKGWRAALGDHGGAAGDENAPLAHNLWGDRRISHLLRLFTERPAGWLPPTQTWDGLLADALRQAIVRLHTEHGPSPSFWAWGHLRVLIGKHGLFEKVPVLKRMFNLGPFPHGGDSNTIAQAGVLPLNITQPVENLPNLRTVFDLADWENCRYALFGGQSGNPTSAHYDDQLPEWTNGPGVRIPWAPAAVLAHCSQTLRLHPASVSEKNSVGPR
ncbi:MAG: penicillin acylase family protein, partial [Gemmataceae bacterium]